MNVSASLCVLSALVLSVFEPSTAFAAPLKSSKVMKDLVRQCEYVDGVIVRVLASRECPVIETNSPTPVAPATAPSQPVVAASQQAAQSANAKASDDIILEKAISRCTNIGYKRETAEFRSCVTEQIALLSK